jgi:predicted small secreted protein
MKKTGMFVSFVLLVSALLLAACAPATVTTSQGQDQSSGSSAVDSAPIAPAASSGTGNCSLLSKDEVGTILGQTVSEVRDEANSTICAYQTQDMILEVNFLNTGGLSAEAYMQNIRGINADRLVVVPGLGDESLYNGNANYDILFMRIGDKVNTFGLRSDPSSQATIPLSDVTAKELAVAQLLVTRLP